MCCALLQASHTRSQQAKVFRQCITCVVVLAMLVYQFGSSSLPFLSCLLPRLATALLAASLMTQHSLPWEKHYPARIMHGAQQLYAAGAIKNMKIITPFLKCIVFAFRMGMLPCIDKSSVPCGLQQLDQVAWSYTLAVDTCSGTHPVYLLVCAHATAVVCLFLCHSCTLPVLMPCHCCAVA